MAKFSLFWFDRPAPTKCIYCRRPLTSSRYGSQCSWKCYNAYHLRRKRFPKVPCAGCGELMAEHHSHKYCRPDCKRLNVVGRVPITEAVRRRVFKKSDGMCVYCGERAEHIEHVHPYAHGGTNDERNLVAACVTCNYVAADRVFDTFESKRAFILAQRNIRLTKPANDEPARPAWHARVYGGMRNKGYSYLMVDPGISPQSCA